MRRHEAGFPRGEGFRVEEGREELLGFRVEFVLEVLFAVREPED